MENQHSINGILSFSAKSVAPEILERLLVGRSDTATYLADTIESIALDGNNQQLLIIGQRGMGKTHLLRVLYSKATKYIKQDKLFVAYFSEEEYGVSNYFDFLIRILYAFIRWNGEDKDLLESKIDELHSLSAAAQANYAEKIIQDYIGKLPLLILAENFADILNGIGKAEQSKLRAWMYRNQRVSIIATSQAISDDFDGEDKPFFEFFNIYYLKPLNYQESFDFLVSIAELDERPDVVAHLKGKGQSQVRAIHDLVKGNHRLLVTFYEFLKSNTLAKLSNHFIKTINDLKPYYETFIRYLPPQQQKIVRFVALSRKPQQGTDIAKNCFIEQKSLSKQLSELVRKKLLEAIVDSSDKRNRLYDIDEPLLRISIEVGEHKEGITALFVDFLALYYNEDELKDKLTKISELFIICESQSEKQEFEYEMLALKKALHQKDRGSDNLNGALRRLLDITNDALERDEIDKGILLFENEAKYWKENENSQIYYSLFVRLLLTNREFKRMLPLFNSLNEETMIIDKLYTPWGLALKNIAKETNDASLFDQAVEKFKKANKNAETSAILYLEWGSALVYLSFIHKDIQEFKNGISVMENALIEEPDNLKLAIEIAKIMLTASFKFDDENIALESIQLYERIAKADPITVNLYQYWGSTIAMASQCFKIDAVHMEVFKSYFNQLEAHQRHKALTLFARVPYFSLVDLASDALREDLHLKDDDLISSTVEWYINILSYKTVQPSEQELIEMKDVIKEAAKEIPELVILEIYIDTFIAYKIKGKKKAIYNLPKEQRVFFLEKIAK